MQSRDFFSAIRKSEIQSNLTDSQKERLLLKIAKNRVTLFGITSQDLKTLLLLVESIRQGYEESGDYLIKIIAVNARVQNQIPLDDVFNELEKIHTRNATAAYVLGRLYTGLFFDFDNKSLYPSIQGFDEHKDREEKAIYYLQCAISQNYEKAQKFLSKALTKGAGCIVASPDVLQSMVLHNNL